MMMIGNMMKILLCLLVLGILHQSVHGEQCEIDHCMKCENGDCTECEYGWFGQYCIQKCHGCWHGGCNQTTGICIQCSPGYYKEACDTPCPDGCHESYDGSRNCDRTSGSCLEGCTISHWGTHCKKNCSSNCVGSLCEQRDGTCLNGCSDGWYGLACNQSCSQNCLHNRCSLVLGQCSIGCNPGFAGLKCGIPCENCIDGKCSYNDLDQSLTCTNGCTEGWTSADCKQRCSSTCLYRVCDRTGACQRCVDGHYGDKCLTKCPGECQRCDKRKGHCILKVPTIAPPETQTPISGSAKLNSVLYLILTSLGLQLVRLTSRA